MSEYSDATEIARQQLNNISDTMCYAKWSQVSLHLTNGMTQSCYHPPVHKIDVTEIYANPGALHNTEQKRTERAQMLAGERPKGCEYCWRIEDSGGTSDRVYRSGEYWAQNSRKDIIASTTKDLSINPRYVEVNFNQACNFKCTYCSPHLSTTWETEVDLNGPLEIFDKNRNIIAHNDPEYLDMPLKVAQKDNPYVDAFWRWWPDIYDNLEVFRMTGGEPLMDSNTFKVLDYIYEKPNAWLELSITTNLNPPKEALWDKFLTKMQMLEEIQIWESPRFNPGSGNNWYVNMAVKHTALFVSVDNVTDRAEYIRTGLDFVNLHKKSEEFLSKTLNTSITYINTFNVMSMEGFTDYLKFILQMRSEFSSEAQGTKYIEIYDEYNTHPDYEVHAKQRVWFDVPLLRYPDWMAINILDDTWCDVFTEALAFMEANLLQGEHNFVGFYDFEIEKVRRNLEWMTTEHQNMDANTLDINLVNLKHYTDQLDQRHGTDFAETFPRLHNYLDTNTGVSE
jgi:hypothetical protein